MFKAQNIDVGKQKNQGHLPKLDAAYQEEQTDTNELITREYQRKSMERILNNMDLNEVLSRMDAILKMKPRFEIKPSINNLEKGIQSIKSLGFGQTSEREKYSSLFHWHHQCLTDLRKMLKNKQMTIFQSIEKQQAVLMMSMQKFISFLSQECEQKGLLMNIFMKQHLNLHVSLTEYMTKKLQKNLAQRIEAQNTIQQNFDEETRKLKQQLASLSEQKNKKWKNLFMLIKDNRILRRTKGKLMRELQASVYKEKNLRQNLIQITKENQRYKLMFQSSDYDEQGIQKWMRNWMNLIKIERYMQKAPLKAKKILEYELEDLTIKEMESLPQKIEYVIKALEEAEELFDYQQDLIDFFEPCKMLLNGFCQTEMQTQQRATNTPIHHFLNASSQTKTHQLMRLRLKFQFSNINIQIDQKIEKPQKGFSNSGLIFNKGKKGQQNKNNRYSNTFSNLANLGSMLMIVRVLDETVVPKYIPPEMQILLNSKRNSRRSERPSNSSSKKLKLASNNRNYLYYDSSFQYKLSIFSHEIGLTFNGKDGFIVANKPTKQDAYIEPRKASNDRYSIITQQSVTQLSPIPQPESHPLPEAPQNYVEIGAEQFTNVKTTHNKRYSEKPFNSGFPALRRVSNIGVVSYSGNSNKVSTSWAQEKNRNSQKQFRTSHPLEQTINEEKSEDSDQNHHQGQLKNNKESEKTKGETAFVRQSFITNLQRTINELSHPSTKNNDEVSVVSIQSKKSKERKSAAYLESRTKTQPIESGFSKFITKNASKKNNVLTKVSRLSTKPVFIEDKQKDKNNYSFDTISKRERLSMSIEDKLNSKKDILDSNKKNSQKSLRNHSIFAVIAEKKKQRANKLSEIQTTKQQSQDNNVIKLLELKKKQKKSILENKNRKLEKIDGRKLTKQKQSKNSMISLRNPSNKMSMSRNKISIYHKQSFDSQSQSESSLSPTSSQKMFAPNPRISSKLQGCPSYLSECQPESQYLDPHRLVPKLSHLLFMNRNDLKSSGKNLKQFIEPNLKNLFGVGPQSHYQSFNKSLSKALGDTGKKNIQIEAFARMLNYSAPHEYQVDLLKIYIIIMEKTGESFMTDLQTANWIMSQVVALFYSGWKKKDIINQMQNSLMILSIENKQFPKNIRMDDLSRTSPQIFTKVAESKNINMLHFFLLLETQLRENCLQTQLYKFCKEILPQNETDLSFWQIRELFSFMPNTTEFQIHMARLHYFCLTEKDRERWLAGEKTKSSKTSGMKLHRLSLYCSRQLWNPLVNIVTTIEQDFKQMRKQIMNNLQMIELFKQLQNNPNTIIKGECPWLFNLAKNSIHHEQIYRTKVSKHLLMLIYVIEMNLKINKMNLLFDNLQCITHIAKNIVAKNQLMKFLSGTHNEPQMQEKQKDKSPQHMII